MDYITRKIFDIVIFALIGVITLVTIIMNTENYIPIILYTVVFTATFVIRHLLLKHNRYKVIGKLTLFMDTALIYLITSLDATRIWEVYFYLVIIEAVTLYSFRFSAVFAAVNYFLYVFFKYVGYSRFNYFDWDLFSPELYDNLFFFIIVFAGILIVKHQVEQKKLLSDTMQQLSLKKQQLEATNRKLSETMQTLEKIAALKERNRIAGEIHDTVGHTLTTVLVEMEAGKRLIPRKPELAAEKIELAEGQVRKGLDKIRYSVRTLQEGNEFLSLTDEIRLLLAETEKHALVLISHNITPMDELSAAQKQAIYSSLQEGLTNGIRHGKCTRFDFCLKYDSGNIHFILKDNGTGCEGTIPGFGLTSMRKRAEMLGGRLLLESPPGAGFCIEMIIPIEVKETNSNDKHSDC